MREFGTFDGKTQRYIRISIAVAQNKQDILKHTTRSREEAAVIKAQQKAYLSIPDIIQLIPLSSDFKDLELFFGKLLAMSAFDLAQCRLPSFPSYRFLYERLLGSAIRPWLPSAYCGAAALPQLQPEERKLLLQSISEAAATAPGWSKSGPIFYPEWVDKEVC